MTADEARRLTLSNLQPERLEDYRKAQEVIKRASTEIVSGRVFQVMIKGPEFHIASIMHLLLDGYHVWYDWSELATHIEWFIDTSKYNNAP